MIIYQRVKYFLKAAESGSFAEASRSMYVTSQALTKQIHLLEEDLGGKLFERHSNGVELTTLGNEAYKLLSKVDNDLETAFSQLRTQAVSGKQQVNIGIFSSLPQEELVTPVVSFLLGGFSEYQINLNLVELNEGKKMISDGSLDLFFSNYHEEDSYEGCSCYYIEKHEAKVVVSLYHPWMIKDSITVDDMKRETFIKMEMADDGYNLPVKDSFFKNIPCKNVNQVSNFKTLFALLQQGGGFAVFPKAYAYMEQAKMKYFDYPDRKFCFYTGMIYNPRKSKGSLDNVIGELVDEFNMKPLES